MTVPILKGALKALIEEYERGTNVPILVLRQLVPSVSSGSGEC